VVRACEEELQQVSLIGVAAAAVHLTTLLRDPCARCDVAR
jgi:hypothetical protein